MTKVRTLIWMSTTCFLLCACNLAAQDLSFTAKVLSFDFNRNANWNPLDDGLEFPSGAGLFVGIPTSRFLTIGADLRMGKVVNASDELIAHTEGSRLLNANVSARVQDNTTRNWLSPYLQLGGGALNIDSDDGVKAMVKVDLGIDFRLYQNMYLSLGTSFSREIKRDRYFFDYGIGFTMKFGEDSGGSGMNDLENDSVIPDRDLDGVLDTEDACPDEPGSLLARGCPDQDGDGVADLTDVCPTEAGLKSNDGCPLTTFDRHDQDALVGNLEKSPSDNMNSKQQLSGAELNDDTLISSASENRVIDTIVPISDGGDIDSIAIPLKREDTSVVSPEETVGEWPEKGERDEKVRAPMEDPTEGIEGQFIDTDGDGISDDTDRCPEVYGSLLNNGCPDTENTVEISEDADEALPESFQFHSVVTFESGYAALDNNDFSVLDEVAEFLRLRPSYNLIIYGHTDDQGGQELNELLSMRRARACYYYLVLHGIEKARVDYLGRGSDQPAVRGMNEGARQANRRVVFEFVRP